METYEVEIEDWGIVEIEAVDASEAAKEAVDRHFVDEVFRAEHYSVKVRPVGGEEWQEYEVWGEPTIDIISVEK